MKKLKKKLLTLNYLIIFNFLLFFFISKYSFANEQLFQIEGNEFTDNDVILSLLKNIPESVNKEYTNEIIKSLNESNLFSNINVKINNNKFVINVEEYPSLNKITFNNNERLKDEELELLAIDMNLINSNKVLIQKFISEIKKIYESFGYNNVAIDYNVQINDNTNTADINFDFTEGQITKINRIIFQGNNSVLSDDIKSIITSKTKTIRNIFANNNFKPAIAENDKFLISNYYKNIGYIDVSVKSKIEFLKSNKVNLYFIITEGDVYSFSSIKINDEQNILNQNILKIINLEIDNLLSKEINFSNKEVKTLKTKISSLIIESGIEFFEIKSFDNVENNKIDILFQISPISPRYTKQINIVGNSRTFDYVIRRELDIVEGDALHDTHVENIRDKLVSLNLFENVKVRKETIDNNNVNLIIEVEEKQTGSFNAGVSVGTLDGFSIVTGLRERNFYGTGRSLDVLLNTSDDRNQFKLITTDRISYENDANISYSINYKQEDFSKASSYKLDTFSSGIGIGYKVNKALYHNIDFEYVLKDYRITNSSTASESIINSSGGNISYLVKNNLRYSTLNRGFIARNGNYINFNNTIETPTSSSNGYFRNIITLKKYYGSKKNIFSIQTKLGNIISLNNNDILTDDKFALGGRWLRGFDNYGAGPRNSRSSYVGGNNLIVTKLDYSYEISSNSDFPILLNLFNDYGYIWENKTNPTQNDNSLRSSLGFGIKYYSPIGPIGFSWGFPVMDEEYDIKRMFLFSVGNID